MAEIKQGQRSTPYAGANVLGAYRAGRGTPTGTGLQPEAEQMIRLAIVGQLSDIRRAELDIARQGITSYSNIAVARLNAQADVINAASNMARSQQMDRQTTLTLLTQLASIADSYSGIAGQDVPDKAANLISTSGRTLTQMMSATSGTVTPAGLVKQATDGSFTNQQLENALTSQLGGIVGQYVNVIGPTLDGEFRTPGMDVRTIVDTKNRAEHEAVAGVGLGYDNILRSLPNTDLGNQYRNYLSDPMVRARVEAGALGIGYDANKTLKASDQEKSQANNLRKEKQKEIEILRRQIESSGVSMSPGLTDSLNNLFQQTDDIIALGPDGFAEKMQSMETPVEMSVAKQRLQTYLDQIDNPTDKLSESVGRFLAEIPYAENYMAAMGLSSPLETVRYLRNNPEEFREYYRIASRIGRTDDADQLLSPDAIRERLRVAGSSNAKSMFRRKNLTKPVERLVGFGINRPEAMRYFAGSNTSEQLDAAIIALRSDPESFDDFVRASSDAEDGEQVTKETASTARAFAQSVPEEKRERVARAAERFRRRIGAAPEEEKTGRFVLPGLTTEMRAKEERPILDAEPATPVQTKRTSPNISVGGGRVKSRQEIEAEIAAEKQAEANARKEKVEAERARLKAEEEAKKAREAEAAANRETVDLSTDAASQLTELDDPRLMESDVSPDEPAAPRKPIQIQGDSGSPNVTEQDKETATAAGMTSFLKEKDGTLVEVIPNKKRETPADRFKNSGLGPDIKSVKK